jgi:hypothetical protein
MALSILVSSRSVPMRVMVMSSTRKSVLGGLVRWLAGSNRTSVAAPQRGFVPRLESLEWRVMPSVGETVVPVVMAAGGLLIAGSVVNSINTSVSSGAQSIADATAQDTMGQ